MVSLFSLSCLELFECFVFPVGFETIAPLIIPLSVASSHFLHSVHSCFLSFSILPLMFHILFFVSFLGRVHGLARSTARNTRRPKLSISGTDFLGCSLVPLLLHNSLPVFVIVDTIDESHLCQMSVPVSVAGLSAQFSSSSDLLWRGWWWFWSRWFLFLFCCSTFSVSLQNFVFVLHVPLVFSLLCQVWIFVRHTEQNWFLSTEFVYIYRLVRQS